MQQRSDGSSSSRGPLVGLRVLEFAGVGPVQFAGMMLADMGAEVIRIDRPGSANLLGLRYDILDRGRRSVVLDLKRPAAVAAALRMCERCDVLIEGYRPGVMERLGLGPDRVANHNVGLVYGRATGWGQFGPLASAAGHDINYISLTGALHAIGERHQPSIPLNLLGDFGAGGMMLAFGVLSGLYESQRSGKGQVIDAAMSDGVATLLASIYSLYAAGKWIDERRSNLLDGASPIYGTYRCADQGWVSIGPLEPKFYALLLDKLAIDAGEFPDPSDRRIWPRLRAVIDDRIGAHPRQYWCDRLQGSDVCFAPVLSLEEAPRHPHNVARATFVMADGVTQPAPAPRFSRTAGTLDRPPPDAGAHTAEVLGEFGFSAADIAVLQRS
jgi:alpha-methylacyl-CoA racemase